MLWALLFSCVATCRPVSCKFLCHSHHTDSLYLYFKFPFHLSYPSPYLPCRLLILQVEKILELLACWAQALRVSVLTHIPISCLTAFSALGIAELLIFHPVDTVAKRLMSNKAKVLSPIPISHAETYRDISRSRCRHFHLLSSETLLQHHLHENSCLSSPV